MKKDQFLSLSSRKTILKEQNFKLLGEMFDTPESYAYYMKSLWVLRSLIRNKTSGDPYHSLFPLFDMTNNLIGALLLEECTFDQFGDIHKY